MKVIYFKSEHKSFSWNDGLFAIQKEVRGIVHLWKIKDGKLDRYEDGTPNISCTSINNKGIIPTDLMIDESDLKTKYRVLRSLNYADTTRDEPIIETTELDVKDNLDDAIVVAKNYINKHFVSTSTELKKQADGNYSATDFCSYGATITIQKIII